MKIVINTCFGGYCLSEKAYEFLGLEWDEYGYKFENNRTNPKLIECVETLGKEASGWCADLKVVEIPDHIDWTMEDYDGKESIHEIHQQWY